MTTKKTPQRPHVPTVAFGLLGFAASLYALIEHLKAKGGMAGKLGCDVSDTVSCSSVLTSEYAEVLQIPLGGWGMAFWSIVVALGLLPKLSRVSSHTVVRGNLVLSSLAALSSVGLGYLAYFKLKAVCPVCTLTYIISLSYALYSLVSAMRSKRPWERLSFLEVGNLVQFSAIPSLAALLISFFLALPPVIKGDASRPLILDSTKTDAATLELLKINRSNYVGDGEDYRKGSDSAKVTVQVFTDPECPYCGKFATAMDQAMKTVGSDKVLYVARVYPLDKSCNSQGGNHFNSCRIAVAARCAGQQGKFWEILDWAYTKQSATDKDEALSAKGIEARIAELGLEKGTFNACLESQVELKKVQNDIALGRKLGLTGTPLIYINGVKYMGNPSDPAQVLQAIQRFL
jgi:protein-disulfide isomerase